MMNRERLKILRDHLAGLPDERFDMTDWVRSPSGVKSNRANLAAEMTSQCGTVACIAGWTCALFPPPGEGWFVDDAAEDALGLNYEQAVSLFMPRRFHLGIYTRADAIAAVDSMLASPDDDALPVWPEAGEAR